VPLLILIGEKDDWTPAEPCPQSGATTGDDPQAWVDSINDVVSFFEKHLKQNQNSFR